jgi:2-hydroxyglutarate dehydrogenase
VVVGVGVVGLAVARELALAGREVWVIEGATDVGTGTSSRNSEVVHAGIYYPQGSLKVWMQLYKWCALYFCVLSDKGRILLRKHTLRIVLT